METCPADFMHAIAAVVDDGQASGATIIQPGYAFTTSVHIHIQYGVLRDPRRRHGSE